jgi:hypothetical protein
MVDCYLLFFSLLSSASFPLTGYWSFALESTRKDVECSFGIARRRFRIIRDNIRVLDFEALVAIVHTCIWLHNLLLEMDTIDDFGDEDEKEDLMELDEGVDDEATPAVAALFQETEARQAETRSFNVRRTNLIEHYAYYRRIRRQVREEQEADE